MVLTVNMCTPTKEEIECKGKLLRLTKEYNCTITSFLKFLINQTYELEYPNKGKDYKEFIKEWKGKNGK